MKRFIPAVAGRDLSASFVVFLVALPLCMGIAVASGMPPEKGLLTGIIGGIVVGLLAGSPLQVSGPAAGLAVLVFEIVREQGISALGPILLLAGLIQLVCGFLRLGGWFRAISPAVVHGMLAGIGVLIVASQFRVLFDAKPLPNGLANLTAIPRAFIDLVPFDGSADEAALVVGLVTIATMIAWERMRPGKLALVPGALIGIAAGIIVTVVGALPVKRVAVPDAIWDGITLPTWSTLSLFATPEVLLTALAVAFIASAETLLSASAVDRMHGGVRTNYDRELAAQGIGNMLCGLIGALPMTGVIVRSSANVQAGAVSRASTILHGVWLLAFVALLPAVLRQVPMASLGGVLVVTGWRLINLRHARELFKHHGPFPVAIWAATLFTVVAVDLLTGVIVGLALTGLELLPRLNRLGMRVRRREVRPGQYTLALAGNATFVQLPRLLRTLEAMPAEANIQVRTVGPFYLDHTCREAIADWAARRRRAGAQVILPEPMLA